jgi:hypothetical protein
MSTSRNWFYDNFALRRHVKKSTPRLTPHQTPRVNFGMRFPHIAFSEVLHIAEVLAIVGVTVFAGYQLQALRLQNSADLSLRPAKNSTPASIKSLWMNSIQTRRRQS